MAGGYAPVVRQRSSRGAATPAPAPRLEPEPAATVEIIRGDKRAREVVSQE
jgi:hypothetical protein